MSVVSDPIAVHGDPGPTPSTAYNLGTLTGRQSYSNAIGGSDTADTYRITMHARGNLHTALAGGAYARIDLLRGDGSVVPRGGAYPFWGDVPAGTYFIKLSQARRAAPYTITLRSDYAGASAADARNVGNLGGSRTFGDFLGSLDGRADDYDYYQARMTGAGRLRATVSGVVGRGNVRLTVQHDANANGRLDAGERVLVTKHVPAGTTETIDLPVAAAGNYYLAAYNHFGATNYRLTLSALYAATPTPQSPGGTPGPVNPGPTNPTTEAPSNLRIVGLDSGKATLRWQDNSNRESAYRIARSADGVNWHNVGVTGPNATQFTVSGLDPSVTYQFKVRATVGPRTYTAYSGVAMRPPSPPGALFAIDRTLTVGQEHLMQPYVFYPRWYLAANPDIGAALGSENIDGAVGHWISYGIREGRAANPMFNGHTYFSRNPDVAAAYGATNYAGAAQHWLVYGIGEGRAGT